MKIAVIGRTGQLASSLIERAAKTAELELVAIGRPELDLADPTRIAAVIADEHPDLVINAAAYTAVDLAEDEADEAFRINADAAGEVAAAAAAIGAAIVQISTDYVFDGRSSRPYAETDAVNPINVYGRSKLAGEERVRAANPNHVILRTSWVYSPFGRNFVLTMMKLAESRDTVSIVADQFGNPTSALDLADAIMTLAGGWARNGFAGLGDTYHLAGRERASWFEMASAVFADCAELGMPSAKALPIATADWPTRAKRPLNSELDCSRFGRQFGLRLPPWRASVRHVVERAAAAR